MVTFNLSMDILQERGDQIWEPVEIHIWVDVCRVTKQKELVSLLVFIWLGVGATSMKMTHAYKKNTVWARMIMF